MTFLTTRGHVALEIEAVAGTGETIVDADVIHPIFEPEWSPDVAMGDRDVVQDSFSRIKKIAGERFATISFAVELRGEGNAGVAPTFGKALQACAFLETIVAITSVRYTLLSEALKTATVEYRMGGIGTDVRTFRIIGAMGTVSIEATKGEPVMLRFTFTGKYVEPTDASTQLATPTIGPDPAAFLSAAISFFGTAGPDMIVQGISLDLANTIVMRNDANDATGNVRALTTGRVPTGSIDPEQILNATLNFFDKLTAQSEGALSYVLDKGAGNKVTVSSPAVQIATLANADREAIATHGLDLVLNGSGVAGDDEIDIFIE